jgi:hypothetical protein
VRGVARGASPLPQTATDLNAAAKGMVVMKLRVPEGCEAISHLGRSLDIAEDNSIEMDDAEWSALLAHGFRPWADRKEAPDIERMTREELIVGGD